MVNRSHALAFVALSMSLFACSDRSRSITRAKEGILRDCLFTFRTVIDEYGYDKQKAPQSLQDLVSEGYIKRIPEDPMTGSANSWSVVREDIKNAKDPKEPGIIRVRSGSDKTALDGSRYSDW
jgi:general secretion pathway protein G